MTIAEQTVDLWRGDCLAVLESLQAQSIRTIVTDPPYMLSAGGFTCKNGKRASVDKGDWDLDRGIQATHDFNLQWLTACRRVLHPDGTIWISGTHHVYPSVGLALQLLGFRILNDVIWEKPAPPPNLGCRCLTHSTETLLWAARSKKSRYTFNYADLRAENGGKQMKTVWRFSPPREAEKAHGKHPTQKPVALMTRCMRACTRPGEVVLDPFMGSGTTGVAAVGLGLSFLGIELDAHYLDLAKRRLSVLHSIVHVHEQQEARDGQQEVLGVGDSRDGARDQNTTSAHC